jgi:apolipoprotein N-acyltransferase
VTLVRLTKYLPLWKNALLAVLAAVLLILSFPDFEFWFLAWFALVPLLFAIERETERGHSCPHERESVQKNSPANEPVRPSGSWGQECPRSFVVGWIFGVVFFFGTCWWLTFAPITYAGFPPLLAYFLLFCVTAVAAIFPGLFAAILSVRLRSGMPYAMFDALLIWPATEFLRYWITGNNWNSIAYSQAFGFGMKELASIGGIYFVAFGVLAFNVLITVLFLSLRNARVPVRTWVIVAAGLVLIFVLLPFGWRQSVDLTEVPPRIPVTDEPIVVAIQPNVPMSGMTEAKWNEYRRRHVALAESALATLPTENRPPTTVVFPESPMNFAYESDPETQAFINAFAIKNNVSVLFNSAEPDVKNGKFYNSAVMVGPDGKEVAQYDKIYLLPFGEAVPFPLDGILPGFVGNFSYGGEYDLFPFGDAKGGVMICFESHFGQLSREYVRNGADVIIEMTNDGYLGPTPVLRQHLANAVFRAVETNRPVLRVTNVGITAYINERGQVSDELPTYQEGTRVWSVARSDGSQTFYVKYGDWFAWLCSIVTIGLLIFGAMRKPARE